MSTIAILGAAGATGKLVVEEALKQGHVVRALVRQGNKGGFAASDKLSLVVGDATRRESIEEVMKGADVVVGVLGAMKGSVKVESTRLLIAAAKAKNIRFIRLASAPFGVRSEEDKPTGGQRFLSWMVGSMMKEPVRDELESAEALRNSSIEWTLVRAPMLHNDEPATPYRVGSLNKQSGSKVSRRNVAKFIVDEIAKRQYLRKSPLVTD